MINDEDYFMQLGRIADALEVLAALAEQWARPLMWVVADPETGEFTTVSDDMKAHSNFEAEEGQ